jgi:hypothetical protein
MTTAAAILAGLQQKGLILVFGELLKTTALPAMLL